MITENEKKILTEFQKKSIPRRIYKHKFECDFIMFEPYIAGYVSRALTDDCIKGFNKEVLDQGMKDFFARMVNESENAEERKQIEEYTSLICDTVSVLIKASKK